MRRRRFVQALAGGSAASALLAQQPAAPTVSGVPINPAQPVAPPPNAADELPKIEITVADAAADPMPRFFTAPQLNTLRKLSGTLTPGAVEAKAPEFLDFLLSESLPDRQRLYREGLDALNSQSGRRFNKPFADLDDAQVATMLAPLHQPWTFAEPADPAARFLRAAKVDVRTATVNSPDAGIGHRFVGTGQYWYPLD